MARGSSSAPVLDGLAAWRYYVAFLRDQVGTVCKLERRYGPLLVLRERLPWRRRVPQCLLVSGAQFNRQVLNDTETFRTGGFTIRGPRGSVLNRLRRGPIGANGETHRQQRRLVSSFFQPKTFRQYHAAMVDVIGGQLDSWQIGETTDLAARVSEMSLLVSAQNLLPTDPTRQAVRLGRLNARMLELSYTRRVWLLPVNVWGTPYWRLLRIAEEIERQILEMIDRRSNVAPDTPNLLDRLISVRRGNPDRLSREEIVEIVYVLFGASHETVAKAVTWSLFLLIEHPHIWEEVRDELRRGVGDDPPSMNDLANLPLLDAVTKEAMRLFPPVPCVARRVRAPTELGGVALRPRDYVVLNHYSTQRNAEVFAEPDQFRPERWFDGPPDNYDYLPFSAGPRTCTGKALGTVTIKLMVAMIVQRYTLAIVPHSRIDRTVHLTLAPKFGIPVTVLPAARRPHAAPVTGNIREMVDLNRGDTTTRATILPMTRPIAGNRLPRAA